MKIYRIIYQSIYIEEGEIYVGVKTFLNKEIALEYLKKEIIEIKKQVDNLEDYCVEEKENSYERYLNGRASEDYVSIYIEEDETFDEKYLQKEKEKEYEI